MRMQVVSFKAYDEDKDKWSHEASAEGITLGSWIRKCLGAKTPEVPSEPKPKPEPVTLATVTKIRATSCEHRLPAGTWCKTCRTIKR